MIRASAGAVALWLAVTLVPAPPVSAQDPERLGSIELVGQSAWVPADGTFELVMRAPGAAPDATLEMSVRQAVPSRLQFLDAIERQFFGSELFRTEPATTRSLEAASGLVTLEITPEDVRLEPGVYPVVVTLRDPTGIALDSMPTHMVRVPDMVDEPLAVATILRVDTPPSLEPDGSRSLTDADRSQLVVLTDVTSSQRLPLTVIPTPETLDALGDRVGTRDGPLLIRLRQALRDRQLIGAPYARVDVSGWVAEELTGELAAQLDAGAATVAQHLEVTPDRTTWLADAQLTPEAVDALAALGVERFVVPESALEPLSETRFPNGLRQAFELTGSDGTSVTAAVVDPNLQGHFGRTGDPVRDAYELLADLAVIYFEQTGRGGGVVLMPPDDWVASQALLTTVLSELDAGPIVAPVTVGALFDELAIARDAGERAQVGAPLERSPSPKSTNNYDRYAEELTATSSDVVSFEGLAEPGAPPATGLRRLVLASGDERLTASEQLEYLSAVDDALSEGTAGIGPPPDQRFTLAGRAGTIPLQVTNDLGHPVNVLVAFDSDKLDFPDGQTLELDLAEGTTQFDVRVEAKASGDSTLEVALLSPDGSIVLGESRMTVRSTQLSNMGIVIAVAAGAVLVMWWGRHQYKRRRAKRLRVLPGGGESG